MSVTTNPLVVGRTDTTTAFAGTFLLEDGEALARSLEDGDWIGGGLAVVGGAMDAAAAVSDPLGTAFAMGVGWVLDHVAPLTTWLEDLTGDADEVAAFAGTWTNVAAALRSAADDLSRAVRRDLADMDGAAVAAYVGVQLDVVDHLEAAARWADATTTALGLASSLVQAVHDLVRDAISEVVGAVASYATEVACTAGLATPLVVEQASTRTASLAGRIGGTLDELLGSVERLRGLVDRLRGLLDEFADVFRRLFDGRTARLVDRAGAARGAEGLSRTADAVPSVRRADRQPMTMATVHAIAKRFEIDLEGIPVWIDKSRAGVAGITLSDGSVVLTRSAFTSEQELARTLFHERFHVEQLRSGLAYPCSIDEVDVFEDAAKAAEEEWWTTQ